MSNIDVIIILTEQTLCRIIVQLGVQVFSTMEVVDYYYSSTMSVKFGLNDTSMWDNRVDYYVAI